MSVATSTHMALSEKHFNQIINTNAKLKLSPAISVHNTTQLAIVAPSHYRQRPNPDAPHPGKRCPPRVPSCRPHSAQSPLARAGAVGLVTGPHACTPRTHSQWVVGPAARPKGRAVVGDGRAPDPGRRTPGREAPPPGALVPPPHRAKPARKSARYGVGDGSPRPHPPHPQPVGSGPRPHAPKDGRWGVGQRPTPDAPHPGKRRPPRAPSCRPRSAQSQVARARAVGLPTGPHARTPRTHSQWVVGPGRTPERTGGRAWESARPRTPHTKARGAPPGRPRAAPTARKANTQKQACPQGGARPQARQGDEGTGPPPHEPNRRSTGPRQETRRGTNRLERPYRRPAREPRVVRAPHRPGGGRRRERRGSTSTHTHNGHAARTRRATGPSPRNAQTAWNGVLAGEGKGHPGGTTRNTHREGREGREEPKGRHKNRHRPRPPKPAARAAHTRPGHCTRQGSSSTQCYALAPGLGSLRASPWGSHWRQASSTGPAAPAARATTHQGGGVVGKRLQLRLLSDALTGEH